MSYDLTIIVFLKYIVNKNIVIQPPNLLGILLVNIIGQVIGLLYLPIYKYYVSL
jgi:hypothetical protein